MKVGFSFDKGTAKQVTPSWVNKDACMCVYNKENNVAFTLFLE